MRHTSLHFIIVLMKDNCSFVQGYACMYVCMYETYVFVAEAYIGMYVWVVSHAYVYRHTHDDSSSHIHISVYTHTYKQNEVMPHIHTYIYMCTHTHIHIVHTFPYTLYIHVYRMKVCHAQRVRREEMQQVCVSVYVCLSVCLSVCICLYICMYVHAPNV